jgi:hypothetical protein
VVKWAGGLYLLYLGIKLLRAGISPMQAAAPEAPGSLWKLFGNTYLVTALNPKGIVFFVAFLPQFINPGSADVTRQLWVLAATFVVMASLNATLYAVFAASARTLLASPRAQRRFQFCGWLAAVGGRCLGLAGQAPGLSPSGQDLIDEGLVGVVNPAFRELAVPDGVAQQALQLNRPALVFKLFHRDDQTK